MKYWLLYESAAAICAIVVMCNHGIWAGSLVLVAYACGMFQKENNNGRIKVF
jgi:Na+/serine symporter